MALISAIAAFVAAGSLLWSAFSETTPSKEPTATPARRDVDLSATPEGWTQLPPPPEIRTGAATVWTGSQLLVWGGRTGYGESHPANDGFAFDAASGTWGSIPAAPIAGRSSPAAAWTGSELLIWGGWDGSYSGNERGTLGDGAAYDPATQRWRLLPASGLTPRAPLSRWTGDELSVGGTSLRTEDRPRDGAAYDPGSDSWRPISEGPIELTDAVAVWTGTEMIVFGAALHGGNIPETPTAIGAAYDPARGTWRRLPASDIDPNANTASWLEDRLIAWDYSDHTSAHVPGTDSWQTLLGPPVDACEDVPQSVTADGFVFGQLCGELVVMLAGEDRWHNVTRRDLPFRPVGAVPVGDLGFVLGYESYAEDAAPRMYAFRPPRSFACGGFPGLRGEELARAVAARFELLRSDRPEALARPEIEPILSRAGEAAFEDPARGLGGLFAPVALDTITSVERGATGGFLVTVRLYDLDGEGMLSEELLIRAGTSLSGDDCELLVDDARPIDG